MDHPYAYAVALVAISLGIVDGLFVWNAFGYGGPSDGGYSPRGKPAAARVERWMGGEGRP